MIKFGRDFWLTEQKNGFTFRPPFRLPVGNWDRAKHIGLELRREILFGNRWWQMKPWAWEHILEEYTE